MTKLLATDDVFVQFELRGEHGGIFDAQILSFSKTVLTFPASYVLILDCPPGDFSEWRFHARRFYKKKSVNIFFPDDDVAVLKADIHFQNAWKRKGRHRARIGLHGIKRVDWEVLR